MYKALLYVFLLIGFFSYSFIVYVDGTSTCRETMMPEAIQGKLVFQKYNCIACHQLYGLGGYLGPELTTVMSQPGKGDAYCRAFIQSGTPRMPKLGLSEAEIHSVLVYLQYIDKTATTYR